MGKSALGAEIEVVGEPEGALSSAEEVQGPIRLHLAVIIHRRGTPCQELGSASMNKTRLSFGIVLVLVGAVWALQGLNVGFVPESAMTGQTTWVVLGSLGVLVGLGLIWWSRTPRPSGDKEQ